MTGFWGAPYGIPEGPWDTFGGPAPVPAMERRAARAPMPWSREWKPIPDARTLHNILDEIERGNFYGFELRPVASPQLALEIA